MRCSGAGLSRGFGDHVLRARVQRVHDEPGKAVQCGGYLNNGCTAFLIDADHIAAAAHCFVDTATGQWAPNLRFYPNFHPDRVTAGPMRVAHADVLRVVVGTRT